jgi:hypothetical protein
MAKLSKECVDEALKALINFKREDLEDYLKEIFVKAGGLENLNNARAYDAAIKDINKEYMQQYLNDCFEKANNITKFKGNEKLLKTTKSTFKNLLLTRDGRGVKLSESIVAEQQAEYEKMLNRVLNPLTPEETEHLTSGKLDQIICDAIDGKKPESPLANKIADIFNDYILDRKTKLVMSNAMRLNEINEDRSLRAIHDQTKVTTAGANLAKLAGDRTKKKYSALENFSVWRDFIKPKLNLEKTFQYTKAMGLEGKLDHGEVDKILKTIYDNITTGKSDIFTKSTVANDAEAITNRSRMFFHWNSMGDLYAYNKAFGRGNFFSMLMRDMSASSNKIGLAKRFGTNPKAMYNDLRKVQQEVDPKGVKYWAESDLYMKAVMQQDRLDVAPRLTNFIANTKMVTSMARLFFLGLDSISDIGYQSAFAARMGVDQWEAYGTHLTHIFNSFPTEERRRIARLMKSAIDSHLGFMGRWADESNVSSWIEKISTKFFRLNFLEAFDKGAKISNMNLMAKSLAENSNKSFKELNPQMQQYVGKFLDEHEWDLLRKKNQMKLFTTDNVDALTHDEIKAHHEKTGSDRPLGWMRDDLYRKVHSMFMVNAENTVLTPTAFERAFLMGGLSKGSLGGSILSLITQFKYYPLAYIDRVLVGGWRDADTATRKIIWATSMAMGTAPLAYLSTFLHNLALNKSMPQFSKMNASEREQFLLSMIAPSLGGTLGMMLDSKLTPAMRGVKLLSSPSTTMIGHAMAIAAHGAGLEGKKLKKDLSSALGYVTPLKSFPVLTPIIENALGEKAYLEPGQKKIF